MKKKEIQFKAFVDGQEILSSLLYELNHCIADECIDISNDLAMKVVESYTEEAEIITPFDI